MTAGELSQPQPGAPNSSWFKLPSLGRKDIPMLGISVGHACTHWYPGAFVVMLPFFAQDLGLSLTQVGILIGLRSVTSNGSLSSNGNGRQITESPVEKSHGAA